MPISIFDLNGMVDLMDENGSRYWNDFITSKLSLVLPNVKIQLDVSKLESIKSEILSLLVEQGKNWKLQITNEINKDFSLTFQRLFIVINRFSRELTQKSFLITKGIYENQYLNIQIMNLVMKYIPKEIRNQYTKENPAKVSDIPSLESKIVKNDNYLKEKNAIKINVENLVKSEENKRDQLANKLSLDFLQFVYDKYRKVTIKIAEDKKGNIFAKPPQQQQNQQ